MREKIFAMAVMAAGLCLAAMDPIDGSNAVGILKVGTPSANSKTLAVPYEQCLGAGTAVMLADLVSTYNLSATASEDTADEADRLVVLVDNEGTQEFWYYFNHSENGWTAIVSAQLQPDGDTKAVTPTAADEFAVARGQGFWIERAENATDAVYLKGQVATTVQSTQVAPGLNLFGIATTGTVGLNDVDWTGAFGADKLTQSDMLVVDNAAGLPGIYYFDKNSGKWVDRQYQAATVSFSGSAFWYNRKGTGAFTFKPAPAGN